MQDLPSAAAPSTLLLPAAIGELVRHVGIHDCVTVVSMLAALLTLPVCLYLAALTLCARARTPPPGSDALRLVCVVPAHDEENGIAATVQSLLGADYPEGRRSVLVVADNCSDKTAERALDAGAQVLERVDPHRRGKGHALEAGFTHVLQDERVDGVLVVDADTVVASNFWRAAAAHIAHGAAAVQVANLVKNPYAGWRPGLQAIAMALINGVRSLGRERLGLSVGLRGTGMAFSRATLERVPHRASGLVEDVEYGIALGLAGLRVTYAPETWIASDAPTSAAAALSQRRRWEGGRVALARRLGRRILHAAVKRRSLMLLDLGVDLLVPPLTYPALALLAGTQLEGIHVGLLRQPSPALWVWLLATLCLVLHVVRGVVLSGTGMRGFAMLLWAPLYMAWKVVVARPWRTTDRWVRTPRVQGGAKPLAG